MFITLICFKLCLFPIAKSFGSWAGVTFTQPVPKSLSTCESAIIGISLSTKGTFTLTPINSLYLSSSGLTATAVSPKRVSGLVVATSKYLSNCSPLSEIKGYLKCHK